MKSAPPGFAGPIVSMATGITSYPLARSRYLSSFLAVAISAAPPAVTDVTLRYECANVSITVTSQTAHFPELHGINVSPSGRLPLVRERPVCSFVVIFLIDHRYSLSRLAGWKGRRLW